MAALCETQGSDTAQREALPTQGEERLVLNVLRFINAAYDTGDAACSEAAHVQAEAARGVLDGALLVARATAVIRLLRAERPGFAILPPACRWLSDDEAALMRFVRGTHPEGPAAATLPQIEAASTASLASAARDLLTRASSPSGPRASPAFASAA